MITINKIVVVAAVEQKSVLMLNHIAVSEHRDARSVVAPKRIINYLGNDIAGIVIYKKFIRTSYADLTGGGMRAT